jgi:hypothetical protein
VCVFEGGGRPYSHLLLDVYEIKCVDTSQRPSSPSPFGAGYYLAAKLGER